MFKALHEKLDDILRLADKIEGMISGIPEREPDAEGLSREAVRRALDLAGPDVDFADPKDPMHGLPEVERKQLIGEMRDAILSWLEKDLLYYIGVQTQFVSKQSQTWEQVMFGRGAISAYAVLLERYKRFASQELQSVQDKAIKDARKALEDARASGDARAPGSSA